MTTTTVLLPVRVEIDDPDLDTPPADPDDLITIHANALRAYLERTLEALNRFFEAGNIPRDKVTAGLADAHTLTHFLLWQIDNKTAEEPVAAYLKERQC